jgi:hypothetical protein
VLSYERPAPTNLAFEGDIDSKHVRLAMTQRDLDSSLLVSRGFNWVQTTR